MLSEFESSAYTANRNVVQAFALQQVSCPEYIVKNTISLGAHVNLYDCGTCIRCSTSSSVVVEIGAFSWLV